MLDLEFAELTDRGLKRAKNEDAVGHSLPSNAVEVQSMGWFFALADGLGGHEQGEVASRLAIETVVEGYRRVPKGIMHVSLLPKLVQEANVAVYDRGHPQDEETNPMSIASPARMASTIVVCALRFDSAVISHVGDSRCYLLRDGGLQVLTRDHTMAGEQVRLGILSEAEAMEGQGRHVLTRCLGTDLFVAADTVTVNIIPGDVLLLCSDGLYGFVAEEAIVQTLKTHTDLKRTASALVAAANDAGGQDNVSVQLIRVRSVERMGLYRVRPYRLL